MSEYLECEDCGKKDETVQETYCPFSYEIYDDKIPVILCPDCFLDRADDI